MENIWWMALVGGAACGVLVLAYGLLNLACGLIPPFRRWIDSYAPHWEEDE